MSLGYIVWALVLPKFGNFERRVTSYELPNGERGQTLIKVPLGEIESWDKEHNSQKQSSFASNFKDEPERSLELNITEVNSKKEARS